MSGVLAAAWAPRERIGVTEWADRYRVLGPRVSAEPGPFRSSRTPYIREIQDALSDTSVREVVLVKPAQWCGSELGRNWMGWTVDVDPGPFLLVFPTEDAVKENMEERVLPMFSDSPKLSEHVTGRVWDLKRRQAYTDSCTIYVAWSGSPTALASRPIMRVLFDEVDKFVPWRGKEASPIALGRVRTATFGHRGKVYIVSTPTLPTGQVMTAYQACPDRRRYHLRCPCGELAEAQWAHVLWDGQADEDHASLLKQVAAFDAGLLQARYKSPCCGRELLDRERWPAVEGGRWQRVVEVDRSASVGFHGTGLISPWTSFSAIAREYVAARLKGMGELQHFFNSILGEPFFGLGEDNSAGVCEVNPQTVYSACNAPQLIPSWATVLVAAADTQKTSFNWVVRAFGRGYRSRLIAHGVAQSFEELRSVTLGTAYASETGCPPVTPQKLLIDSGGSSYDRDTSRTEEVYRFSRTDPERIMPIKGQDGATRPMDPVRTHDHTYQAPRSPQQPLQITLTLVDVFHFKGLLASWIATEGHWEVGGPPDRDYTLQVASEHKVLIERRVTPDGRVKEIWRWVPRSAGAANHYWDAEVYAAAGAYVLEADRPEPLWPQTDDGPPPGDDGPAWWNGVRRGGWR